MPKQSVSVLKSNMALISSRAILTPPTGLVAALRTACKTENIDALPPISPVIAQWCKSLQQIEPDPDNKTEGLPELLHLCTNVRTKPVLLLQLMQRNSDIGRYAIQYYQRTMNKTVPQLLVQFTRDILNSTKDDSDVKSKNISFYHDAEMLSSKPMDKEFLIELAHSIHYLGAQERLLQLPCLVSFWKDQSAKNAAFMPHPLTTLAKHGLHTIPLMAAFWNETSVLDRIVYARYTLKELPYHIGKSFKTVMSKNNEADIQGYRVLSIQKRMDMLKDAALLTHPVLDVMDTLGIIQEPSKHASHEDICRETLTTCLTHMNAFVEPNAMLEHRVDLLLDIQ